LLQELRDHHHRLQALWELSLGADTSSDAQLRALLGEAASALQCEYVELYSANERTFVSVGSPEIEQVVEMAGSEVEYALGPLAERVDKPTVIEDIDESGAWGSHPLVASIPLRSVLIAPLMVYDKSYTLICAWKTRREVGVSDEESRYIKFLARVVARLLEKAQQEREISSRIITDPLTGLHNRAATLEQIAVAVSSAERNNTEIALFYVDLDGFKEVNDTYGHAFGDIALAQTAQRMRGVLRKHEMAGRIGGDEFALLITSFNGENQLVQIVRRVLSALREPIVHEGAKTSVRASVGIAIYPRDGTTADELLAHADAAMYQAKRQGTEGYAFYGTSLEKNGNVQHLFAAQLANTAMEREFFLCYQPIVDARTGRTIGAEALIRWLHPGMGLLSPHAFLDASRDQRVLGRIEEFVIGSALEKQAKLRRLRAPIAIHVNVSEPNEELLAISHDSRGDIHIEISEPAVAADEKAYTHFIEACRARGFRVGLSQFGCGGLSLQVLARLPLDFVKVGRGIIPDALQGQNIFSSIAVIETANRLGWSVIAENVEEAWQQEWLVSHGASALQGYFICSPLTESDFDNWLQFHRA
jgi:diguanylate cyclase (GGDEF)-like protein